MPEKKLERVIIIPNVTKEITHHRTLMLDEKQMCHKSTGRVEVTEVKEFI